MPGAGQADKLSAIRSLLPVLGASHQSVREQYFTLLEDRLGIPYPTLDSSVRRMLAENAREAPRRDSMAPQLLGGRVERSRLEMDAARMLLSRPALAARGAVTDSMFLDSAIREIIGAMISAEAKGVRLHTSDMSDRMTDPSAAALLLLAVSAFDTVVIGLAYVALFGIGSMLGMAVLSFTMALPLRRMARYTTWGMNGVNAVVGTGTVARGVMVMVETAPAAALWLPFS